MKTPVKIIVIGLATLALAGGAFLGGMTYQSAVAPAGPRGAFAAADGALPQGGPLADLTDAEREEFANMTAEERQAFLEEQGFDAGSMPGGPGGPTRGGFLEGSVVEVGADTITISLASGGSQTVYTDDATVIAYAEGAAALTAGSEVMVQADAEADGVTTASVVVVK